MKGRSRHEQEGCEHAWELLDTSSHVVGGYNDLYYGLGRRVETRRFFCSKCREVAQDETITEGVGLR